jgi:hypothetical protein
MGILGKVMDSALQLADVTLQQSASNQGFEAGTNGQSPRTIFAAPRYQEAYEKAYERGQEASKTNLANSAGQMFKKL